MKATCHIRGGECGLQATSCRVLRAHMTNQHPCMHSAACHTEASNAGMEPDRSTHQQHGDGDEHACRVHVHACILKQERLSPQGLLAHPSPAHTAELVLHWGMICGASTPVTAVMTALPPSTSSALTTRLVTSPNTKKICRASSRTHSEKCLKNAAALAPGALAMMQACMHA